jgi:hypothetical protein
MPPAAWTFKRLDEEIKQLRNMPLRPAALAAAIAEIEKERDGLLAKATLMVAGARFVEPLDVELR